MTTFPKPLLLVFGVALIVISYGFLKIRSKPVILTPQSSGSIVTNSNPIIDIFWSIGCSHCENIKNYLSQNPSLSDRFSINLREISQNQSNYQSMIEISAKCPDLDLSAGLGVPFAYIYSENQCLMGDQPIINWLKQHLN